MSDLRDLYQEVIIDHNKNPRNYCLMKNPTHQAEGFNPLCGDQLKLYLIIEDNKIKSISFEGKGCAISTASASLMTEILLNKSLTEAEHLFQHFHDLMISSNDGIDYPDLGKLLVLKGVREFPSRIKCATLPWHALHAALYQQQASVSTE
jgi:nitrogen fixation NifU-like protein